jgi:hypothetical protein
MTDKFILDVDGNPQPCEDIEIWGPWMENRTARRIGKDTVGESEVSTVFLGLDHGFGYSGLPILFETMIFGGQHDGYQTRYCTKQEALEGHLATVKALMNGADPNEVGENESPAA